MHRYAPEPELDGLVQRFWIPVWWVRPGQEAPQRVLQYPVCLVVVTPEYARLSGVVPGLSTTRLTGDGWAVGVMLSPAAGFLLAGASVAAYADAPRPYLPVDRERALVNRLVPMSSSTRTRCGSPRSARRSPSPSGRCSGWSHGASG